MVLQAIRKTKGPLLRDRLAYLLLDGRNVGWMVEFSEADLILQKVLPREAGEFFDACTDEQQRVSCVVPAKIRDARGVFRQKPEPPLAFPHCFLCSPALRNIYHHT